MAAPALAMAINGLALKPSSNSPASLVLLEPVTSSHPLSSSSPSSSSVISNCSSSINSPLSGSAVVVQAATSGTMVGGPAVAISTAAAAGGTATSGKDSGWLTLEVCREHIRQRCTRSDTECRFAHPPPHVDIQNGRVVCCFDSIKGRCQRTEPPCKYLHPPQHLKEQLLQNGRNNLIMKNLQQIQRIHQHSTVLPSAAAYFPVVNPYLVVNPPSNWYASYYNASSIQQGIVPTTSGHNGCVSIAPAPATPTATVAPAAEQPTTELEPCAATGVDVTYSNVQTVSQAGAQYWALSPSGGLYGTTSPYYSPCSAVYYQNGNYSIPNAATTAMIVPKRTTSASANIADGKNGYSAVYPCGSAAYQQMALSTGPVDMPSCYAMAITVPPPVNGFYGC